MSFEIAYKMGQLRAKLDGDNAVLMDEIVELVKKEESAGRDTISIPFIKQDDYHNKWHDPQNPVLERTITCGGTGNMNEISVEASMAADNPETFGTRL